jgi:WhiB family transcriptional regulator, redox-sensing transcriptional regulator
MSLIDTNRTDGTAVELLGSRNVWEQQAACRDLDTALFFSDDLDEISEAKRICLACPVRGRCLDAAVDRGEQYGVWGGHLFVAGRIVLHKRRRGRPPKTPRPGDRFPEVEVPDAYRRLVTA